MIAPRPFAAMRSSILAFTLLVASVATAQTVSYITPEVAGQGMSVAIEFIGPNTTGNFGADGFYDPGVKVALQNASDSQYVVMGHSIVSWDGKLVQAMIMIRDRAPVRDIPLIVKNGASQSAAVTFSIVPIEAVGRRTGGGTLGGNIGKRWPRGAMVVDSLVLDGGTYTVSTTDPDGVTAGNQSYLPLRILSKGPVRLLNGATIDVRGKNGSEGSHGGPGGGGGGGGAAESGGDGFTGGGGVGPAPRKGGTGTGSVVGSRNHHGGNSLNGVGGGLGTELGNASEGNDEGGGGGTGHPFGLSGDRGIYNNPSRAGGYGAGSGGGQGAGFPTLVTYGGGGAGYFNNGNAGGGTGDNSGNAHGNKLIAPFAGGSGGGSGNIWYSSGPTGRGGGGGGAIEITSFNAIGLLSGTINARGGNGSNGTSGFEFQHGSGGGGGSGGAITLSARDSIVLGTAASSPTLGVAGGSGGTGYNVGGNAGSGRVRLNGRVSSLNGNSTTTYFDANKDYIGPVVARVTGTKTTFRISGFAKGWNGEAGQLVKVYYKFATTGWRTVDANTTTIPGSRTAFWTTIDLDRTTSIFDTDIYVVAVQRNTAAPGPSQYLREPQFAVSHTSAMIGKLPGIPLIAVEEDTIFYGSVRVGDCKTGFATINSIGSALLRVDTTSIEGPDPEQFVVGTLDSLRITPGSSDLVRLSFCPTDTGCYEAIAVLNSNDVQKTVRLIGCGILPELVALDELDFGDVRLGTCKDSTITVSNNGTQVLRITRNVIGDPAFTLLSPTIPLDIQPGQSAQFTFRFCPPDITQLVSYDSIFSNARVPRDRITLLGRGVRGEITFADTLDFGKVLLGACKDSFITITNIGTDTAFITDIVALGPEFTVRPGQLPASIAPSRSLVLNIEFCPALEGIRSSADSIRALAPTAARQLNVKGEGVKGLLSVPNAIEIPCLTLGSVIFDTIILRNTGSADVTGLTLTVAGSTDVTITQAPPATLGVGQIVEVIVRIEPTTIGDIDADLIARSAGSPDLEIPVRVHVTKAPTLEFTTTLLDFDTLVVGSSELLCVRVTNPSCEPLTITGSQLVLGGSVFTIENSPALITLVDSQSVEFCIRATPTQNASYTDSLRLITTDTTFTSVGLIVQGAAPFVTLEPDTLDFGDVPIFSTSAPRDVLIINSGLQDATIPAPAIAGANAVDFAASTLPITVPAGDTVRLSITMQPQTIGSKSAIFTTPPFSDLVVLIGNSVSDIVLEPDTLNFGVNPVQVASTGQDALIINRGTREVTIPTPSISGIDAADFVASPAAITIAAGDTARLSISFMASTIGPKLAYLKVVPYGDSVILRGTAISDTIGSYITIDSAFARPGQVVQLSLRNNSDLSAGNVRDISVRIHFDPMSLDLRSIATFSASSGVTVTATKHSLGDHTITVRSDDGITPGVLSIMEFEVLLGSDSEVPVRVGVVSFGGAAVRLDSTRQGMVFVQECDTARNISVRNFIQPGLIRPNPASHGFMIPIRAVEATTVSISIYNAMGAVVGKETNTELSVGQHELPVNVERLSAGAYHVAITDVTTGVRSRLPLRIAR